MYDVIAMDLEQILLDEKHYSQKELQSMAVIGQHDSMPGYGLIFNEEFKAQVYFNKLTNHVIVSIYGENVSDDSYEHGYSLYYDYVAKSA